MKSILESYSSVYYRESSNSASSRETDDCEYPVTFDIKNVDSVVRAFQRVLPMVVGEDEEERSKNFDAALKERARQYEDPTCVVVFTKKLGNDQVGALTVDLTHRGSVQFALNCLDNFKRLSNEYREVSDNLHDDFLRIRNLVRIQNRAEVELNRLALLG